MDFLNIGLSNGIDFYNFGIRNGTDSQDSCVRFPFFVFFIRKIGMRLGLRFPKIGIRNGYVFEASMARPQPKSGQVHPPGFRRVFLLFKGAPCDVEFENL